MQEPEKIIKKLQLKDQSKPILILDAPEEYINVIESFQADVHNSPKEKVYGFIQAFGTSIANLKELAERALPYISEDGLLWLCYPKKSSKKYKGTNCNRDEITYILGDKDYEPVRMVALNEDWSALRFRHVDNIKVMKRKKAATEKGKEKIKEN